MMMIALIVCMFAVCVLSVKLFLMVNERDRLKARLQKSIASCTELNERLNEEVYVSKKLQEQLTEQLNRDTIIVSENQKLRNVLKLYDELMTTTCEAHHLLKKEISRDI